MSAYRQCLMAVPLRYAHGRTDGRTYGRSSYYQGNMTLSQRAHETQATFAIAETS